MKGTGTLCFPATNEQLGKGQDVGIPNPAQEAFLALKTKVCLYLGGPGAGKTSVAVFATLRQMLLNKGGRAIGITASNKQIGILIDSFLYFLADIKFRDNIDLLRSVSKAQGNANVRLANGSIINFYTAGNIDAIHGDFCSTLLIDEVEWFDQPERIYEESIKRLREQSKPGISKILEHRVFISSTAQYSAGFLKKILVDAEMERAKAKVDPSFIPEIGAVVAPSNVAINYGLTKEIILTWAKTMQRDDFERQVQCKLKPPKEVIFGDHVSDNNILDNVKFVPGLRTLAFCDWGINNPHFIIAQLDPARNAIVLLDEWGPDGALDLGEMIRVLRDKLIFYGVYDQGLRALNPLYKDRYMTIGDPTTITGRNGQQEIHTLSSDARAILCGMKLPLMTPNLPEQRNKYRQIAFLRSLLAPRNGKPRILISRNLCGKKDEPNRPHKLTRRGIYWALTEGFRYVKNANGDITERILKDDVSDHAIDALLYGVVTEWSADFHSYMKTIHGIFEEI